MKNRKFIEVDSLKEIWELVIKNKCYIKENGKFKLKQMIRIRIGLICYKKNPNYIKPEFNKYIGKKVICKLNGEQWIINRFNKDIFETDAYRIESDWFSESALLNNFIIEGVNDK